MHARSNKAREGGMAIRNLPFDAIRAVARPSSFIFAVQHSRRSIQDGGCVIRAIRNDFVSEHRVAHTHSNTTTRSR
jgi:hypothetical protein